MLEEYCLMFKGGGLLSLILLLIRIFIDSKFSNVHSDITHTLDVNRFITTCYMGGHVPMRATGKRLCKHWLCHLLTEVYILREPPVAILTVFFW